MKEGGGGLELYDWNEGDRGLGVWKRKEEMLGLSCVDEGEEVVGLGNLKVWVYGGMDMIVKEKDG